MTRNFLSEMKAASTARVALAKTLEPEHELRNRAELRVPLDFRKILVSRKGSRIIAEIKRKSPSLGDIAPELDSAHLAQSYAQAGAAAISVLTEPLYFGGNLEQLERVRAALPGVPLLMKDFVVDPYQILQARAHGADAVLLISSLLGRDTLKSFLGQASNLGLTTLVEVHDELEFHEALDLGANLIGINNRDLRSLKINLDISKRLALLKGGKTFLVSESGISSRHEVEELERLGIDAFLVGTHLVRNPDLLYGLRGDLT